MLQLSPFLTGYILTVTAILGLVMGSFLNCLAWRLVHHEPITKGRSHCAVCGHTLRAGDLVPVFSWLFLRGRCRYCGEKISPRYPFTELLCAVCYVSLVARFDLSWETLLYLWLFSILLAVSLVDFSDGWIPNSLLVIGGAGYFPLAYLTGGLPMLGAGLLGGLALFLPMLGLILLADKLAGTETMGGGDLKLIGLLGLYFGWQKGWLLLFLACLTGLLGAALAGRMKRGTRMPFGPALALAAWVTALWGERFLTWYGSLFL